MIDTVVYDPHSPKSVSEIVGNTKTWTELNALIQANKASHLVLSGPAACGKTLFLRLALTGFPTLVIDCTSNFGLRDVRDSIRIFARGSRTAEGRLRWILFEHADSLTADTQAFLRRMLETTSANTRIVFECRDAGAITEPILSRSAVVSVNAPAYDDAVSEVLRRTANKLSRSTAEMIVTQTHCNMRGAILNALACVYEPSIVDANTLERIQSMLASRPPPSNTSGSDAWIKWAIVTEQTCRLEGIDLRDILRIGWPTSPIVAHTCTQWSRLGGTSPRTMFFTSLATLIGGK